MDVKLLACLSNTDRHWIRRNLMLMFSYGNSKDDGERAEGRAKQSSKQSAVRSTYLQHVKVRVVIASSLGCKGA